MVAAISGAILVLLSQVACGWMLKAVEQCGYRASLGPVSHRAVVRKHSGYLHQLFLMKFSCAVAKVESGCQWCTHCLAWLVFIFEKVSGE